MKTTARPMNDFVLVKRQEAEKVTAGGLHIPEAQQKKNRFAEVLAVGPGRYVKESLTERRPVAVKPGDVVVFRGTAGEEIELDGESGYLMLREDELEGVVESP